MMRGPAGHPCHTACRIRHVLNRPTIPRLPKKTILRERPFSSRTGASATAVQLCGPCAACLASKKGILPQRTQRARRRIRRRTNELMKNARMNQRRAQVRVPSNTRFFGIPSLLICSASPPHFLLRVLCALCGKLPFFAGLREENVYDGRSDSFTMEVDPRSQSWTIGRKESSGCPCHDMEDSG
jgi:hypothetical protein